MAVRLEQTLAFGIGALLPPRTAISLQIEGQGQGHREISGCDYGDIESFDGGEKSRGSGHQRQGFHKRLKNQRHDERTHVGIPNRMFRARESSKNNSKRQGAGEEADDGVLVGRGGCVADKPVDCQNEKLGEVRGDDKPEEPCDRPPTRVVLF